ncbi:MULTISPECIES: hypothetical protein [Microbacterium]|uniref:hypothetical protein n=1 Tax=Microbacterium TaxID=33882 RepID=UPI00146B6F82|nr:MULTISPECIES: hypothetical protein [Microbacterium]
MSESVATTGSDRHTWRSTIAQIAAVALLLVIAVSLSLFGVVANALTSAPGSSFISKLEYASEYAVVSWSESLSELAGWIAPLTTTVLVALLVWLAIPHDRPELLRWTSEGLPEVAPGDDLLDLESTRSIVATSATVVTGAYVAFVVILLSLSIHPAVPWSPSIIGLVALVPLVVVVGASCGRYSLGSLLSRYIIARDQAERTRAWDVRIARHSRARPHLAFWRAIALSSAITVVPLVVASGIGAANGEVSPFGPVALLLSLWGLAMMSFAVLATEARFFFDPWVRWSLTLLPLVFWILWATIVVRAALGYRGHEVESALYLTGFLIPGLLWVGPWWRGRLATVLFTDASRRKRVAVAEARERKLLEALHAAEGYRGRMGLAHHVRALLFAGRRRHSHASPFEGDGPPAPK